MGLVLYVFGGLLADYEHSHDTMFKNHDRTYTLRSEVDPNSGFGLKQGSMIYSAVTPIIKAELSEVDAVARTKTREYLLTFEGKSLYQTVRFSDPDILKIFDFNYIYGNDKALNNATSIVITESVSKKFFNDENPVGKTVTLNNEHALQIGAVIKDVAQNSHFNSSLYGYPLETLIPINVMETITGFNPDTNWGSLRGHDLTYVMLPETLDSEWLQTQMDGIYDRHYTIDKKELISNILVYPLVEANLGFLASMGVPAIEIIGSLGYLVLLIACINYANLATAQSMKRTREIGLRKTLGAKPVQLLTQFIVESTTLTIFAMLLTLTSLELLIPTFNAATGKILTLNYVIVLPWILAITIMVGFLSGAYPAYLITKINPIEALKDGIRKGRSSTWVRSIMIGVQFTISVFMMAMLFVVFAQNKNVIESSNIFPKDKIYVLEKLDDKNIQNRQETLKNEMLALSGVDDYSYSLFVPFEDLNATFKSYKEPDGSTNSITMYEMASDQNFFNVYDIPIIAGRSFSINNAFDTYSETRNTLNVVVNELAAEKLGYSSPQDAIGKTFYRNNEAPYTIIGVVEDQNIYGFINN
ncbi:MAG: ABC transporter permease, partial [Emcibacteraceae bacterium]|nr:ABC transporter permease [Emcibacteraceae bacterium]